MNNKLNQLRVKIDGADRALLKALGVRFKAVKELGYLKKKLRMPIVQNLNSTHALDEGRRNPLVKMLLRDLRSRPIEHKLVPCARGREPSTLHRNYCH